MVRRKTVYDEDNEALLSKMQEEYEDLRSSLAIDKFDLDTELVEQPMHYHEASESYAVAISLRDEAKDQMELMYARKDKEIRAEAAEDGEKITEKAIENAIKMDDDYIQAQNYYIKAKELTNKWSSLKDSFHQRAHAMRELVTLWVSDYFQQASVGAGEGKAKKARTESGRQKMTASRRNIKHGRAKNSQEED